MKQGVNGITKILFGAVFVAAGVLLIILGINRLVKLNAGKYVETQAKITKIETTLVSDEDGSHEEHEITVEYQVDGKKFVSRLSENPREFYEGMELTVLYDVDKPTTVVLPGKASSFIMMALCFVGVICGLIFIIKNGFFRK